MGPPLRVLMGYINTFRDFCAFRGSTSPNQQTHG